MTNKLILLSPNYLTKLALHRGSYISYNMTTKEKGKLNSKLCFFFKEIVLDNLILGISKSCLISRGGKSFT